MRHLMKQWKLQDQHNIPGNFFTVYFIFFILLIILRDINRADPKDYMFSQRTNEVMVKKAGEINGQQFVIENCKVCRNSKDKHYNIFYRIVL